MKPGSEKDFRAAAWNLMPQVKKEAILDYLERYFENHHPVHRDNVYSMIKELRKPEITHHDVINYYTYLCSVPGVSLIGLWLIYNNHMKSKGVGMPLIHIKLHKYVLEQLLEAYKSTMFDLYSATMVESFMKDYPEDVPVFLAEAKNMTNNNGQTDKEKMFNYLSNVILKNLINLKIIKYKLFYAPGQDNIPEKDRKISKKSYYIEHGEKAAAEEALKKYTIDYENHMADNEGLVPRRRIDIPEKLKKVLSVENIELAILESLNTQERTSQMLFNGFSVQIQTAVYEYCNHYNTERKGEGVKEYTPVVFIASRMPALKTKDFIVNDGKVRNEVVYKMTDKGRAYYTSVAKIIPEVPVIKVSFDGSAKTLTVGKTTHSFNMLSPENIEQVVVHICFLIIGEMSAEPKEVAIRFGTKEYRFGRDTSPDKGYNVNAMITHFKADIKVLYEKFISEANDPYQKMLSAVMDDCDNIRAKLMSDLFADRQGPEIIKHHKDEIFKALSEIKSNAAKLKQQRLIKEVKP